MTDKELIKELSEALEPFSHPDLHLIFGGNVQGDNSPVFQRNKAMLTIGDFRRAADALSLAGPANSLTVSLDQYGNPVPPYLTIMPSFHLLTGEERKIVWNTTWYKLNTSLCLLAYIPTIDSSDPRAIGLDVDDDGNVLGEILRIDDCLKRGNHFDGWYHA